MLSFRLSSMAMSPSQSAEWQLNRARLLDMQGKPQAALAGLNFQTGWRLPTSQLIRYHLLRAELNETLENPLQAVIERSQADSLIQDPVARHDNIDKTWLSLAKLNGAQLHSLQSSSDPVARGWAELMGLRYNMAPRLTSFSRQSTTGWRPTQIIRQTSTCRRSLKPFRHWISLSLPALLSCCHLPSVLPTKGRLSATVYASTVR